MSLPNTDISTQIAQIDARIADITAQLAADTTTEGESQALGTYLVQLTTARGNLLDQTKKTRKPFRVNVTHRA